MTIREGVVDDAGNGKEPEATTGIQTASEGNASFLRAARAGNVEKILEYLKGTIDINTSNANGLNALHLAAKEGHVAIVTELLKRGANVNSATKKGNTALHIAALAGQEEVAKILIRNGANANVQSQNGFTPLYMAAQENHDTVVKFLLANSASQNIATEDGFTPLAVALQQGHDKVVAVLLENDAKGKVRLPALHIAAKKDDCKAAALLLQNAHDPDVTSKSGFTPLHIAAHYGNENIGSLLLEKNADVNYSAKHQITPLHVAAKWGKSNMVTLLVDKGAKIDASTRDGLTPLHCAARGGHDQVVDLLLEKGAPITAKTKNGLAPLHMASQGDHVDGARILLYHKAPVDDVTVDYLTALHVAAHCGHVRVAKLLLDRKADPNARALNGFTPLHIACKKNRIKVVELLLKQGASIDATTESGLTPLHVASFMGCMNIVIYLIQHGANPDVPTVRGETPLHLAARANQSDIIRILLRNGAHVDASAREQQTPLHIAARLGNVDIVGLLLQHGAAVDAPTKDMYTALHIAAKEGQEEVASVLLDHGASLTSTTKKGFTPLHLAAKYGNIKVARLLLQKDAPVDAQGKNGVTPLHVAAHYDHVNVALLLLDKGAFPHATAKNGYTPLHIAAKKNQMDIATTLLEYGAKPSAESKAGFTPLHLASQEGHTDMTTLLIEHHGDVNAHAKNGLSPLHLCAQEDKVNVAAILVKNGARVDPPTKAGYTPLHVACHFGQINMIRFLLQHGANVNSTTSHGYTPLHQAAQQGHTLIINLLLENEASPNTTTNQGQTALSIAQRLGYISVVETLKIVTETVVTTTTTTITEEKYKVVAPETMQETFMSDSEDEGAEDTMLGDQSFHYLTADEMKSLGDDSLPIDVTRDERGDISTLIAPLTAEEDHLTPQHMFHQEATFNSSMATDNVDISRAPVHAGKLKWKTFLVSFMVDARGGAMRGCRHSGVRVIIPPRRAPMPMRITCRYLRKEKLAYPPPLMEGEACASRILEVGPSGAKFLGPVIIEVPHFAALRGREREITILRSDNGESWREHTVEASDDAVHDVFNESFEGEELTALEDLSTNRITRILTTDFPQYFAIVTRIRQEVHAIGPEGGMVSSTVVPQVQAIFPEGALTKKIKVGLQAQPITPELVTKLLGNRVAVSPIVTVEPRRRKFHKPITLTIPVPQAATKGMINQYSGDAPTLRLLCSITGGTTKAQWEDVTGSTPLTFVNDCVSFTTTVSARFWLMDCRQVNEATKFATELCREAIHVPFMAEFVVFAKRHDPMEAQLRVFCMTDDKEDKTLESQEHFTEVAKSRDVEVLESKPQFLEFAGNLVPVTKSGEQLSLTFQAFRENRLPFTIRVKDPHQEPMGRVAFMREPRVGRGEPPQSPICNLNIALPEADLTPVSELVTLEKKYGFVQETSLAKPELIHRADLRLSDIAKELGDDWVSLALQLDLPESDISAIRSECPNDTNQQALVMLRHWLQRAGNKATGNSLEKGLRKINREDIVNQCMFNVELVTDDVEKAVAKVHLDQSGFDTFKEELGSSRDASLRREQSLNGVFDEQDIMKDAESAAETSSESSDKEAGHMRSESKHPVTVSESIRTNYQDGVVEQVITRTTTKVVEEGPETLVQTVPTALAESFTQQASNGQMSEHEDDKSEPTVATLSSEATAEMEVSSLEDRSQAETHVEKQEFSRSAAFKNHPQIAVYASKSSMKDNSGSRSKLLKKSKIEAANKRVSFNVYSQTLTPSSSSKKKKLVLRRNSWPPDSPQKFNKKRKYKQRLKMVDLREPFWIDSYQWLTMQNAPEMFKGPPLAKLSEFEEMDKNVMFAKIPSITSFSSNRFISFAPRKSAINKSNLLGKNAIDIVPFYFLKSDKKRNPLVQDVKKHLRNLKKKCLLENIRSCEIRNVKPTNFSSIPSETVTYQSSYENDNSSWNKNWGCISTINEISSTPTDVEFPFDFRFQNQPDDAFDIINVTFQEALNRSTVFQEYIPHRAYAKESVLKDCNVISHSPPVITNFSVFEMKQKQLIRDNWQDKENSVSAKNSRGKSTNNKTSKGIGEALSSKKIPTRTAPNNIPENNSQEKPSSNIPSQSKVTSGANTTLKSRSSESTSSKDNHSQSSSSFSHGTPSNSSGSSRGIEVTSTDDFQTQKSKSNVKTQNKEKEIDKNNEKEIDESEKVVTAAQDEKAQVSVPKIDNEFNLGQEFLKNLQSEIDLSNNSPKILPATVIGQSFLKSLMEQHEQLDETIKDKPFPASVIGQTFLNALIEQQYRAQASPSSPTKSIPSSGAAQDMPYTNEKSQESAVIYQTQAASKEQSELMSKGDEIDPVGGRAVIEQSKCKTKKSISTKSIPSEVVSSVVAQSFLKTLVLQQSEMEEAKEQPIPASVVGQAFLKTLMQQQSHIQSEKPIPAPVVGQAFLKTLVQQHSESQEVKEPPIPASVVGQAFLKNLVQQQYDSHDAKEQPIPASVVGQAFLKSLVQQQSDSQKTNEQTIPASVVGQAFLKSLVQQQSDSQEAKEQPIPASVVGQAFLKSLVQQQSDSQEAKEQHIPASVVGQAFLKSLVQQQSDSQEANEQPIPATVVGQAFLKSLVQQQSDSQEAKEQPIPASVVGQAFLKSLVEQQSDSQEAKEQPIPASVVGQAFLKTLVQQQSDSQEAKEQPIPASVVGQAFLKSLVQQQSDSQEAKEQPIPASVVGQAFLKSLMQQQFDSQESKEQPIPASVVGQAFLKSLVQQQSDSQEAKELTIPASVVGQAFLKTLVQQQSVSQQTAKDQPIPAPVVGQAFLKTLLQQQSDSQENKEQPIPASVVSQTFLKSLVQQSEILEDKEKPIPASVVGQAFLKTLVHQQSDSSTGNNQPVPAAVVGQSFLKTLLHQQSLYESSKGSNDTTTKQNQLSQQPSEADEDLATACAIGEAFLKTLGQNPSNESSVIPAAVVGQCFIKDLMQLEPAVGQETDLSFMRHSVTDIAAAEMSVGNEKSDLAAQSMEVTDIIPPPVEFCSDSEGAVGECSSSFSGTSVTEPEVATSIISELLSCTKVMKSVIGSMKENDSAKFDKGKNDLPK